jgi:hypothetical protein
MGRLINDQKVSLILMNDQWIRALSAMTLRRHKNVMTELVPNSNEKTFRGGIG